MTCIDQGQYSNRINSMSVTPTGVSLALCAVGRFLARLAQWHTRRTRARQARQELGALSNEMLKDIGVHRGDIGNLAEELASRAQPCG